jgi:hypothetical protein
VAKFTKEHRLRIGDAVAARLAALSPEERAALTKNGVDAQRRQAQLRRIKNGKTRSMYGVPGWSLDPDFDEGL